MNRRPPWAGVVAVGSAAALLALAPGTGVAAPKAGAGAQPAAVVLPGDARAAAVRHTGRTWLVGGRPGSATARIARRHGATPVLADSGIYVVSIARARAFAAGLRSTGLLSLAEPDALATKAAHPRDPLSRFQWWLAPVVDPSLDPPPVGPGSPVLAVIEEQIDLAHPDMQGNIVSTSPVNDPPDEHGTLVAGAAGAPANGIGIVGIWPGMRVLVPVYRGLACSNLVRSLNQAAATPGVRVINLSYGLSPTACSSHLVATQKAFAKGVALVAAVGNSFDEGNPQLRPATDPHVITAAGLNPNLSSYAFSNENGGVDVSAPAKDVLLPVPPRFDDDGNRDGYRYVSGTSASSPIVGAVATWLLAVRPNLGPGQVQDILNRSADDLGRRGWDQTFGWGKVNLRRALTSPTPPVDPLEPNDDVAWVDGRHIRAHPAIFGPSTRTRTIAARLHGFEDPFDVYRIVIPVRTSVRLRMTAQSGNPALDVYRRSAPTVRLTRGRLAHADGRRTETIVVTNRGVRPMTVLANPYVIERSTARAAYRLEVKKVSYRR